MQTDDSSRKVGLTILIILTVVLLLLSVIIAIRLQGNAVPQDQSVAESCAAGTVIIGDKCRCVNGALINPGETCPSCQGNDSACAGKSNGSDLGCQSGNTGFRCRCVAVSGGAGGCADRLVVNCGTSDASCRGGGGSGSGGSTSSSSSGGGGGGGNSSSSSGGGGNNSTSSIAASSSSTSNSTSLGSQTTSSSNAQNLPDTAIISEPIVQIFIGLALLILGLSLYKKDPRY